VSATGRTVQADGTTYSNLIQTDAAINHGNAGGPLLDMTGRVRGTDSLAVGANSGESVDFAIAIQQASALIARASTQLGG
jgi:serine protease Do